MIVEPQPATPTVEDNTYFKSSTTSNLVDFSKDLDDMVVTLDEGGFWRLLSNSVELSFNLGQLQGATAPSSQAAEWSASVVALEASVDAIDAAIADEPYDDVRVAIDGARIQVAAMQAISDRAI